MKLYLLRHGEAEMAETWTEGDNTRPLTKEGKDQVKAVASALKHHNVRPEQILSSPLTRARQTAEIAADRLNHTNELVIDNRLSPGFNIDHLAAILTEHAGAAALMLVGHEPDFSEAIGALIGGGRVVLKKAGVALIDVPDPTQPSGTLVWLCPSKVWKADL